MKKMLAIALLLLSCPAALWSQTKWTTTEGNVSFTIKNRGSNVSGHFARFRADLKFSPEKLASSRLSGSVDVASINTGNGKRDQDLQGETYFDAARHNVVQVSSTKLSKQGAQFLGTFNVTMKGVTKSVEIPFTFTQTGNTAEFKASFTINRRDFGVGGKGGLAMFMSDDVHVSIDFRAKK